MSQPQPSVAIYGAGRNQLPVLQACQRSGWRAVAIDQNPNALGAAQADRFVCLSLRDHEGIRRALENESLVGVLARVTDHEAQASARALAEERALAAPCASLFEVATSKRALASHCDTFGIRTPRRFSAEEELDFASNSIIVRPDITIEGKAGIRRVGSAREREEAQHLASRHSANGGIDESLWVEGADVSALVRLSDGRAQLLALWDEWVALDSKGQIRGLGVGMPSYFQNDSTRIQAVASRIAESFPDSRCLAALSLRVDESGEPWLIEVHLGIGGDDIADRLIPAATPELDAFAWFVSIQTAAAEGAEPREPDRPSESRSPQPTALLRSESGWRLVRAESREQLLEQARESIPMGWEWPQALRKRDAL